MKNGFTLVELVSVIVILSIIMIIVVPSSFSIYNDIKNDAYLNRIRDIEIAAIRYSESIKDEIKEKYDENNKEVVEISDLIGEGYLESEDDIDNVVYDPRDKQQMTGKVYLLYDKNKYDVKAYYAKSIENNGSCLKDEVVYTDNILCRCKKDFANNFSNNIDNCEVIS